jgi:solute carrier family 25 citrate transporter 1
MATGAFAQVLAGVVYTPIDIVKERMQVQAMMRHSYSYASPAAAFQSLLHQGQGFRGIFKGYWATNAVWLPWNALYIAGYEELKRVAAASLHNSSSSSPQHQQQGEQSSQQPQQQQQQQQQLPAWVVAGCSATAAAAAAVVTHPFDVVKTRLQVLTAQPQQAGLTALQVAQQQLQREGLGSFFHGLTARLLNIAPGCALSWALYEQLKHWLDEE